MPSTTTAGRRSRGSCWGVCAEALREVSALEDRIAQEMRGAFDAREGQVLGLIERLNEGEGCESDALVEQAREALASEWRLEVRRCDSARGFSDAYSLGVASGTAAAEEEEEDLSCVADRAEHMAGRLRERLGEMSEAMRAARRTGLRRSATGGAEEEGQREAGGAL